MKILVACEFSGVVRNAFTALGHHATSCDLLDSETPGAHIKGDIRDIDTDQYDLIIAFPPCTRLCASGARWWNKYPEQCKEAIEFFEWFTEIKKPWCIENPIGRMSKLYRKPDQIIQPWQFGHGETKATCLWLNKLPKLVPTKIVEGRKPRVHFESPSKDRGKNRSRTLIGIAEAMANQWGNL